MRAPVRLAQRQLEDLYRLGLPVDAADFVVDGAGRERMVARLGASPSTAREALWVLEEEEGLSMALCLAEELLGADALTDGGLDAWCAVLEGVSHLLYVVHRALNSRTVTRLELELQAEVDKFLATWFARHQAQVPICARGLRHRLFVQCHIPGGQQPYREATRLAARYCNSLWRRFLRTDRIDGLVDEVRGFWRMDQSAKLAHIAAA